MHVFERQEDQWVHVGRDYAVGPTDIDADLDIVRFIANGRRLGGPNDGEPFTATHEVARGQTVELGPNVLLNVLDVHPGTVRLSIHAPKHMIVLTREDAERIWGEEVTTISLPRKLSAFAADIKLSHSVFALPFALLATCLAAQRIGGLHVGQVLLIVACMIFARTTAMGANRYFDAQLDVLNPRTRRRAIPAGTLSPGFVLTVITVNAALFVGASVGFGVFFGNWLPGLLALPVVALLCAYPLFKRFSALCHYYLGFALALAPPCAEIAIAGTLTAPVLLIALGVLCWTAGFDIIYATVDRASDVETGVHSVPAAVGIGRALWISRATHLLSIASFVTAGVVSIPLEALYFVAVGIAAVLLIVEQSLVRADDLSRVGLAFFTVNGVISLVVGTLGILDIYLG